MLPFMQPKKISSVIIAGRKPDGGVEPMNEEGEVSPELMSISQDLIQAIHAKDAKAVGEALEAAQAHLDDDSGEADEEPSDQEQ